VTVSPLYVLPILLISPVQVCNGDDLSANIVVKSVDTVSVDEAITDPAAGPHCLLNVT